LQGQSPQHKRYLCLAEKPKKCTLILVQLPFLGLFKRDNRKFGCPNQ
jgi:hypothetical protein